MLYKKRYVILFSLAFFYALHSYAQDSCYDCNLDSLDAKLKIAKTDDEKVKLLTVLVHLRLVNLNSFTTDSVETQYIGSLIELSKSHEVKDIEAYKTLQAAVQYLRKNDVQHAQELFKKTITLFDQTHKKIPILLFITRITYNLIGNQEERFQFYTDKLHYYLANGPIENVAPCYHALAGYYLFKADYNLAISNYLKAADIYKSYDEGAYRNDIGVVANAYASWGNYKKADEYYSITLPLLKAAKDTFALSNTYSDLCDMNLSHSNYSKAMLYADSALAIGSFNAYIAKANAQKAAALTGLDKLSEVLPYLESAKRIADSNDLKIFAAYGSLEIDFGYYQYYAAIKKFNDAEKSLLTAYQKSVDVKSNALQLKYLKELSLFYGQRNQTALAFNYTKKFYDLTDSLDRDQSSFKVAQYENEKKELRQNDSLNVLKQQGAVQAAIIKKNDMMLWGSLVAIVLISVSMFFVYRQYRLNRKTLLSLRKTQRQLIMAEKMASLGEITAGIAHEIQNPLNFVNNFSEVNSELISELVDEVGKENYDQVKAMANDIKENEQKIIHHGKRADAIVKGMLQHSRISTGQKEPTDINALADECLRLSYNALRARDNNFNAEMKTDFDETLSADEAGIGKISIVPQDISRVLINLLNNAFYAVTEKKKQQPDNYEPTVSVSTKKVGDKVEIRVGDNGTGIPQKIIDKIFQPFYTTKPTGQGTGLGLSLSYDIVKAHGGEIKVESKEGIETIFTVQLFII